MDNKTLKRIAKALEELIALVKEDLKPKRAKKINNNDLLPWFTQDHGTLPKAYLESCQRFFLELDRRAASRKRQATSLPQLDGKLQD